MTEDDVIRMLDDRLDSLTLTALAARIGVSASFLNHVIQRRRQVSPKIAEYLGLRVVVKREFEPSQGES